jgi:hypothetical protein
MCNQECGMATGNTTKQHAMSQQHLIMQITDLQRATPAKD